jgi:hypothetical protein
VRYAVVSAINLAILLVGIALGVMLAPHIEKTASAHANGQQAAPPQSSPASQGEQYEDITPEMTIGTIATNTLLAHRIGADQATVNGYDLIALDEGIINLLKNKGVGTYRDLDAIIERAKVPRPLRLKLPPPNPTPPTTKPEDKKP